MLGPSLRMQKKLEYPPGGVTSQIVRSIQGFLELIQYAKTWYAVFSKSCGVRNKILSL